MAASGVILLAGSLAIEPPPVPAATITVGGACSLVEAIQNANDTKSGQPNMDCAVADPAGADTILLAGNTYSYDYGSYAGFADNNALPPITSEITIEGNGATIEQGSKAVKSFRILEVNSGKLTLNDTTVSGGDSNTGGGIYNYEGKLTLNNSTVSGNSATSNGGGIHNIAYDGGSSTVTIDNSTISGNTATKSGGGLYNHANTGTSTMTLNNSTVSGNSATSGGGVNNYYGEVTLARTIISGNTATDGREVYNNDGTINANNYNLFGYNNDAGVSGFTLGGADIVPGAEVKSILDTTLANNSPNGDPNTPDYPDTHALVSGSPAIDAAPSAACTAPPINGVDQRGGVRNVDLDSSGTPNECDIGAFEYGSTQTPTAITLEGLTVRNEGNAGTALGATGILALLTGGWLARIRRRKA